MKIYLADIFEEAKAYLWSAGLTLISDTGETFTCHAIEKAMERMGAQLPEKTAVSWYVWSFGVNVRSMGEFNDFSSNKERQGARFLWLCMLETVARDEGAYVTAGGDGLIKYEKTKRRS